MKKIISGALCLMAMALTSLMFTSCGNDDDEKGGTDPVQISSEVTVVVPQHPDAMEFIDYQLTIKSDKSNSDDLSKTISSSEYKDFSSLSTKGQSAISEFTSKAPSGTKYYETTVKLPESYTKFTVDLKATVKTGAAEVETVNLTKGFGVTYQQSNGATYAGNNANGFTGLKYAKFQEFLTNNNFNVSTTYSK